MNEVSTNERVIPDSSQTGQIWFEILIDNIDISTEIELLSITTHKEINKIPSALVVLRDGDSSTETFALSEQDRFVPGRKIEIKGGRDGINSTLFKGMIIRHAIKISQKGITTLTIECRDESVKLTIGRKNKYFENISDSDCIRQILSNYKGITGELEDTNVEHAELVQHHTSDWDFINLRAEANSKIVLVDDGKVSLMSPVFDKSSLTVIYGSTVIELEAEMDARSQWTNVKTSAWNFTTQEIEDYDTDEVDFKEHGNISSHDLASAIGLENYELRHSGQLSALETKAWTKAAMLKSRMAKIRGRVKFTGFADLKPGKWITIQGIGNRFNGTAYVSAVRQEYINGGWFTHAQFGASPEWFASKEGICDFPSAGLIPAVNGLQIGKVVQLENDPIGEDRILIKLPTLDNNARGIWMRIACLDAGNERGSYFRPEIDDEVICGFINNDPRDGIVLGQLNSQTNPAPVIAQDVNHIKGFYTRSKMKIEFDDDQKIMTFTTPGGNSVVISDDDKSITINDETNNMIKMSTNGIELSSPKDIKINALGNIEIKATQSLKMEGLSTDVKASTALTLKGTANATLDGGASVSVKGATIMLG